MALSSAAGKNYTFPYFNALALKSFPLAVEDWLATVLIQGTRTSSVPHMPPEAAVTKHHKQWQFK